MNRRGGRRPVVATGETAEFRVKVAGEFKNSVVRFCEEHDMSVKEFIARSGAWYMLHHEKLKEVA